VKGTRQYRIATLSHYATTYITLYEVSQLRPCIVSTNRWATGWRRSSWRQ